MGVSGGETYTLTRHMVENQFDNRKTLLTNPGTFIFAH